MRNTKLKLRGISWCALFAAVLPAGAAEGDWLRHFRIGGSVAVNVSAEFTTSGTFAIPAQQPSAAGGITYDDGFVGVDATGNANNLTSFWGYNSATQDNPGAQTLEFHRTESFSASGFDKVGDTPLGFDMAYGGTIRKWDRLAIGAEFGFNISAFQTRSRAGMAGTLNQKVDQYSYSGIVLPGAPYVGNDSGVGPVLSSTAIPQADITTPGTISGTRSLEGLLYNFRVGPLLRWEFYPRWTLNGSLGGAFGIFDAEYRFNESVSSGAAASVANRGKFGEMDLTYGGYAGAVVMYDTGHYWEAYLGANFMTLQDGKIESAGRSARMHLGSAVYLSAGINWSF